MTESSASRIGGYTGSNLRITRYRAPHRTTSVVQTHLEVVEKALPKDTALWRPIGKPVTLTPSSVEAWRYHWTGQVRIENMDFLSSHWLAASPGDSGIRAFRP